MSSAIKDSDDLRGPGVPVSPFWIAVFIFGASYLVAHYFPNPIINDSTPLTYGGYFLMALSLYIAVDATIRLNKAKTNVPPWKPTSTIVQTGVYRFTRNPLYVSLWFLLMGLGLVLDRAAVLSGSFFFLIITYYVAVKKEEAYLERKFGDEYLEYKNRVRRWL